MSHLSRKEAMTIRMFLRVHIPDYILEYSDEQFDLMDCYEIGFTFANDILRGKKIDPSASPWGNGRSVIFDPRYKKLLLEIKNSNIDTNVIEYCDAFLDALDVFRLYFI